MSGDDLPVFKMPTCIKRSHFFGGYRWWCKGCRRNAERQFREVCEALWAMQRAADRGEAS